MQVFADYHDEDIPLGAYALIVGAFSGAVGGAIAHAAKRDVLPRRVRLADTLLLGVATHKLSRLLSRDTVTSFLRAPFTRYEQPGGMNELDERPRGAGLQRALGELVICPPCTGLWVAAGLGYAALRAPRTARGIMALLAAQTLSDFLHLRYQAALKSG